MDPQEDIADPEAVTSREEFAAFVNLLREELETSPESWENITLDRFLEALCAYANAVPGYIRNVRSHIDPEIPSWQLFALVLRGASVYE